MIINLSEHEADWLKKLLEVHECEMSDTILERIVNARLGEALRKKRECEQQQAEADGNLYGAPNVW